MKYNLCKDGEPTGKQMNSRQACLDYIKACWECRTVEWQAEMVFKLHGDGATYSFLPVRKRAIVVGAEYIFKKSGSRVRAVECVGKNSLGEQWTVERVDTGKGMLVYAHSLIPV